jgi:hypothetical protein
MHQADSKARPRAAALLRRCCKEKRHAGELSPLYPFSTSYSSSTKLRKQHETLATVTAEPEVFGKQHRSVAILPGPKISELVKHACMKTIGIFPYNRQMDREEQQIGRP